MPPTKQVKAKTFSLVVFPLTKTLQFYWYLGHVLSVLCFFLSVIFGFISQAKSISFYRYTLFFELVSYGIVVRQVHFKVKKSSINQILKDENVQYLLFAIVLFVSSFIIGTLSGSLYSYVIFSFFHSVTYFQSHLLDALPISIDSQAAINSRITSITTNYNQQALFFASAAELMIISNFFWTIPGLLILIFRNPLHFVVKALTLAASIVFVKLRFNDSQYTRTVVQQFDMRILTFLSHPAIPLSIVGLYTSFKNSIMKYIGPIRVPISSGTKKNQ
ncbi:CIC11C00000001451 [Sungouiella intermedia]|uniref:CIC11C00000001451 n=1 Tax=Sungouiella intermedia TaxID=45354 RepID=A0A1L0BAL5_9ASCO|nr:CIC11C00000001451 [[Candida] intermedia]